MIRKRTFYFTLEGRGYNPRSGYARTLYWRTTRGVWGEWW